MEMAEAFVLELQGGSWCRNLTWCAQRKKTSLGSSAYMERRAEFVGILSDDELQNPGTHFGVLQEPLLPECATHR